MKSFIFFLVFFSTSSICIGQFFPEVQIDSSLRTSEYYTGKYIISTGLAGGYWQLADDFKLSFGTFADSPNDPKPQTIGRWSMFENNLYFRIDKRTIYDPRINPVAERPNSLKFRIVKLTWSAKTSTLTENNHPITLSCSYIVLLDDEDLDAIALKDDLNEFLHDHLDRERSSVNRDMIMHLDRMERVNDLVKEYFYEKKLFHSPRMYSNGNLISLERI